MINGINGHHTVVAPKPETVSRRGVVQHWTAGQPSSQASTLRTGISLVLCTYQRPESVTRFLESVSRQTRTVDEVVVIDASRDTQTSDAVAAWRGAPHVSYWRVEDPLRGLTRQRNMSLELVAYDLVAFFDDDVVLHPGCIAEMERAHRVAPDLAGLGCFAETWMRPTLLWRMRRALRVVPHLEPGRYTHTGMSVPWRFHAPTTEVVDGDWLPGCAMMLKTEVACRVGFDEALTGYGQGEDLAFSLRLRQWGRIALAGAAMCQHLHAPPGRPNAFKLGHMEIWNRYRIWRQVYPQPRLTDHLAFAYAWTLDTILLTRDAVRPRHAASGLLRIAGRVQGASRVLFQRMRT